MADYLFIASQSPFQSRGADEVHRLARKRHGVTAEKVQDLFERYERGWSW